MMKRITNALPTSAKANTVDFSALILINSLSVFSETSRKNALYPTLVKMHVEMFRRVALVPLDGAHSEEAWRAARQFLGPSVSIATHFAPGTCFCSRLCMIGIKALRLMPLLYFHWLHYRLRYREALSAAAHLMKGEEDDWIVTALTSVENAGIVAFLLSERHRSEYIIMEHRTDYARERFKGCRALAVRHALTNCSAVIPVSAALGKNIAKFLNETTPLLAPIPNPIADTAFANESARPQWLESFARGRFVFAGWTNWRRIKRIDVLLEAFNELTKTRTDTCLVIAGPVPDWSHKRVAEMKLADSILLTGSLSRPDVTQLARGCDCCVIPSDFETFGLPAIEAMAAGKPSVVTRCGGPESIITNNLLGLVVEPGNVLEFADAMSRAITIATTTDPELRVNHCREKFSTSTIRSQWQEVYNNVLIEK